MSGGALPHLLQLEPSHLYLAQIPVGGERGHLQADGERHVRPVVKPQLAYGERGQPTQYKSPRLTDRRQRHVGQFRGSARYNPHLSVELPSGAQHIARIERGGPATVLVENLVRLGLDLQDHQQL